MGIASSIDERRKALLARLEEPPEPDMEVFSHIKRMLNAIFGEENNQIIKGLDESIKIAATRHINNFGSSHFRAYDNNVLWQSAVGNNGSDFTIIIRFPSITIKNDVAETHEIKDLFVRIPLTREGYISMLQGTRGSVTPEEYIARYRHSHLPMAHEEGWQSFCLGSGPLAYMIPVMARKYDPAQFQMFLLNIREYVSWESISGQPYVRMNTIRNRTGSVNAGITSINENTRTRYIEIALKFLKGIPRDFLMTNIDMKLEGGRFLVTISDALESMITLHFREAENVRKLDLSEYMCYKNTDGKYVSGALADVNLPHQVQPLVTFKGEKIFLKIINKEQNVKENAKFLHPVFKRELEIRLSNYFNGSVNSYNRTGE